MNVTSSWKVASLNVAIPINVEIPFAFRFLVMISSPIIPPPPEPTRIPLT